VQSFFKRNCSFEGIQRIAIILLRKSDFTSVHRVFHPAKVMPIPFSTPAMITTIIMGSYFLNKKDSPHSKCGKKEFTTVIEPPANAKNAPNTIKNRFQKRSILSVEVDANEPLSIRLFVDFKNNNGGII